MGTDEDIQDVVEVFKLSNDLDNLYPRLGLSAVDVANAKLDGSTAKQKKKNVLCLWQNRNTHKATRAVLLEAMGHNKHELDNLYPRLGLSHVDISNATLEGRTSSEGEERFVPMAKQKPA